jgi:exosortase/archaeosortase family protein
MDRMKLRLARMFGGDASDASGGPSALRYVLTTSALMIAIYALVYGTYSPSSLPGVALTQYLNGTAQGSAWVLRLLGETVELRGATVSGRFSYVVVLDCAALDAKALLSAAILAFPAPWWTRGVGIVCGWAAIYLVNVARLVVLYFAGARSMELFHVLHEEVLVFVIIGLVCGVFLVWARWAKRYSPWRSPAISPATPRSTTEARAN